MCFSLYVVIHTYTLEEGPPFGYQLFVCNGTLPRVPLAGYPAKGTPPKCQDSAVRQQRDIKCFGAPRPYTHVLFSCKKHFQGHCKRGGQLSFFIAHEAHKPTWRKQARGTLPPPLLAIIAFAMKVVRYYCVCNNSGLQYCVCNNSGSLFLHLQ